MDYRGPDLDLRTARWSAVSTDPASWREAAPTAAQPASVAPPPRPALQRSGPIWVDETLIACANQAYDVALAYRSAEVRLEHLLLAMTRVEAAANVLEARGVGVVALRRDAAVAIAAEPSTGGTDGAGPRRAPELEDVLRLAATRAAHAVRAAGVDDVVQVLGEIGSDLSAADLIVRHVPRLAPEVWPTRGSQHPGSQLLDLAEGERQALAAPAAAAIDHSIVPRIFDRLAETEHTLSERLAALESALARQTPPAPTDLSHIDDRLSGIESALQNRPLPESNWTIDPAISDRLWAIEQALATERSERASAITALSDEITGVRSAVRLAAQSSEQAQAALAEQLLQFTAALEQHRAELPEVLGERVATLEQALTEHASKTAEAQAAFSAELTEAQEALMKIGSSQQTLTGSIDNWRSNDSGEIHLINARIGAVHEDGARRLAAIEKLCADVDALSRLIVDDRSRAPTGFKRWLYGTEDWVKASWRRPTGLQPPRMTWRPHVRWRPRISLKMPFKRPDRTTTNG